MKRLLAILLLGSMLMLPLLTSCYPGGYNEENPARPEDQQIDVDELEPGDNTDDAGAASDDTAETTEESGE